MSEAGETWRWRWESWREGDGTWFSCLDHPDIIRYFKDSEAATGESLLGKVNCWRVAWRLKSEGVKDISREMLDGDDFLSLFPAMRENSEAAHKRSRPTYRRFEG